MTAPPQPRWHNHQGQPALQWCNPAGDCATVLLHGAQLVSWRTADGIEHLYTSPQAVLDGQRPVRGGVPICFPQFNVRGPLIKHGFARNLPWQFDGLSGTSLGLALTSGPVTQAFWPHAFALRLLLDLDAAGLRMRLQVRNTDTQAWDFTAALHTYLRVADVTQTQLLGLQGLPRWDAVRDVHTTQQQSPAFGQEFDSVYQAVPDHVLTLQDGAAQGRLHISQSAGWPQTVVWNPAAALSRQLADLPDDGWRHMLCVEAASIDQPVTLAAGQSWQAWQQLHWDSVSHWHPAQHRPLATPSTL